jgi:hypothetical protein
LNIFLSLHCNTTIFKRLFSSSKNREEIELQQGTPEAAEKTRKLEIFSQSSDPDKKLNQPEKKLRGIQLRMFSEPPEC